MRNSRRISFAFYVAVLSYGLSTTIALSLANGSIGTIFILGINSIVFITLFMKFISEDKADDHLETGKTKLRSDLKKLQIKLDETLSVLTKERNENVRRSENHKFEILTELLRAIRSNVGPGFGQSRACIFLYNKTGKLYIYHSSGGIEEEEKNLQFGENEGVVGRVFWTTGEPIRVNMDGITPTQLKRDWGMAPEQIRHTRELKSILAVPILLPDDETQMMGILSIDSKEPLQVWGLSEEVTVNKALKFADQLGRFIDSTLINSKTKPRR